MNSERFERAAHALARSMDNFGAAGNFEQAVQTFERSVNKLANILGMQAANDQRKAIGASMAYDESAFANA